MEGEFKLDIYFLVPSFKAGGGLRVVLEIANVLCENHNVEIVVPNNGGENSFFVNEKIKVKYIGDLAEGKLKKVTNLFKCILYLKKIKGIVISTGPIISPMLFLKKGAYNFIQADDYNIFNDKYLLKNELILQVFKKFTKTAYNYKNINFLFNSTYSYQKFLQVARRNDVKFDLVTPAIDQTIFKPLNTSKKDIVTVGFVARNHPSKGLQCFIEACKKVGIKEEINVLLITNEEKLNYQVPSEWVIGKPNNDTELNLLYNECDIFVSASSNEGFGLPGLEAMATGAVLITSDSGGCTEYAKDGFNCLIFNSGNSTELAQAILKVKNDELLRTDLMNQGIKSTKRFTWVNSGRQLINILNKHREM